VDAAGGYQFTNAAGYEGGIVVLKLVSSAFSCMITGNRAILKSFHGLKIIDSCDYFISFVDGWKFSHFDQRESVDFTSGSLLLKYGP